MSNQDHDFLNKELKEQFDDVLGNILDEEFEEKKKTEEKEPVQPETPVFENNDDEFDFSQFSAVLDEIEEEKVQEKKQEEEIIKHPEGETNEVAPPVFHFNLDDLDDELLGEESDEEEEEGEVIQIVPTEITEPVSTLFAAEEEENEFVFPEVEETPELIIEAVEKPVEEITEEVIEDPIEEFVEETVVSSTPILPVVHSSSFDAIQTKLARIQQITEAVEIKQQKQVALHKEVEAATELLLKHVKPLKINAKGTNTEGSLYGHFDKAISYQVKGVWLAKKDHEKSENELSAIELWLLADGTFVEYHYVSIRDGKNPKLVHAKRELVEDVPNLDTWGLTAILEAIHEALVHQLTTLENHLHLL